MNQNKGCCGPINHLERQRWSLDIIRERTQLQNSLIYCLFVLFCFVFHTGYIFIKTKADEDDVGPNTFTGLHVPQFYYASPLTIWMQ